MTTRRSSLLAGARHWSRRCAEVQIYAKLSTLGPVFFDVQPTIDDVVSDDATPATQAGAE